MLVSSLSSTSTSFHGDNESAEEHELLLYQLALEQDEDMLEEPEEDEDYFIIIDGEISSDEDDKPIFFPLFDFAFFFVNQQIKIDYL